MLKAEVIETLLHGCVTWTLSAQHFARLRSAHHQVLLRVIGFKRRQSTDYTTLSYAKALNKTRASKRPSVNAGSSSRGPWHDKTRGDYPDG